MHKYVVGAYIRLSKEDYKNKESESITNQRYLIKEYLRHKSLSIAYEYIDDGYSGTSFDRPGFNRMIDDIEKGKINMVVTKDLSRLGRNYLKSGYYIEEYFPLKKVRYISILDNIDTYFNDNDIAPFKALFNEMVAKDTSRKIKSILESKKRQGKYLASFAPYGYKKDLHDKHKLVIDKEAAVIVRQIFNMFLSGYLINEMVIYLNINKIESPNKYKKIGNNVWSYSSVYNILKNDIYIGVTTQNVWTNISYKNKTKIKKDKKDWIIVKGAHEKIIDEKDFYLVQKKLHRKTNSPIKKRKKLLLEGLLFCKECGRSLGVNRNKKNKYFLICNGYKKNTSLCKSHYMNYDYLEGFVLNKVKKYIDVFSREKLFNLIEYIEVDKYKNIFIKYKKPC